MIELNVHEYCHDCPKFKVAGIETPKYALGIGFRTVITCERRVECDRIRRYLESTMNQKEADEQKGESDD